MLPGGPLAKKQLTKLKIYTTQIILIKIKLTEIDFLKLHKKMVKINGNNIVTNNSKLKKIKFDPKESKYATGRRKNQCKSLGKKGSEHLCKWS